MTDESSASAGASEAGEPKPNAKLLAWMLQLHAAQYYVSGRFGMLSGFVPVSGLLFHHGAEMALKAVLCLQPPDRDAVDAEGEMKEKYGHNLRKLWRAVKSLAPDAELDALDDTVDRLNELEQVRYPTGGQFIAVQMGQEKGDVIFGKSKEKPRPRSVEISVDEVDELMHKVWTTFGLDVKFLKGWDEKTEWLVQGAYSQFNKFPLFPGEFVLDFNRHKPETYPWKRKLPRPVDR